LLKGTICAKSLHEAVGGRARNGIQVWSAHVDWTHVIANDIEHDEHVSGVASLDERLKIRLAAEVGVETVEVLQPVAVITVCSIGDHRRYPYRVKPHA
jgi:hypothetical protein